MTTAIPCRTDALLPLVGADTRVPVLPGGTRRYVDLDGAASTRPLVAVAAAVAESLPYYSSVHRGAGWLSQLSTARYEAARATTGAFVGARPDDVTVLVRHTTDALNLLAGCVPAGGAVLVLDCEHHADLLPWQRRRGPVTVLPSSATVLDTLRAIGAELVRRPYALLAVSGTSNVTGESLPLHDVVRLAHAAGARVLVDGAQLVPHRRFSLADTGVDYVAFSGHKAYAPFGCGALVGRRDWLDAGDPYLAGGGAVHEVTVAATTWAPAPHRHEGGSPNVVGAIALAAACDELAALPDGALEAHERVLRTRLVEGLAELPGVRVLRLWADAEEPTGVVSFTVEGADPGLVAAVLSAEHAVGLRDGRFCAHPLTERLGVPGGALRASVGVGSTSEDVERLLTGLAAYLTEGPAVGYTRVAGRWQPVDDPRPSASALLATASVCGPPAA